MKRKILITVSALALSLSVALSSAFISLPRVMAENKTVYEYEKLGYKNSLDYLIARDGFIYGCDYNWCLDVEQAGHSLGDCTILNQSATYSADVVERDFYNIKAFGYNCTTWWLMPDAQGMIFDDDGLAVGVQDKFISNLRHMLTTARNIELPVIPCLIPHGEAGNYGMGYGGEDSNDIYNKYFRFQWDEKALEALIKNVIEPVCAVLGEFPDVVPVVALNIENMTSGIDDYEKGIFQYGQHGTTFENYVKYLNALHDAVKKYMPNTPTTIETEGGADLVDYADERMYMQNELKVDLISENYYHSGGAIESVSNGYNTRPGYIGEYNTGETGRDQISAEYQAQTIQRFNKSAKENGWLGAFLYSYGSGGADFSTSSSSNLGDYDSFYYWAVTFRYDITDQIEEFKGTAGKELEKSSLLYYSGGTNVYFIPARGAESYTLERSSDGGKTWQTVAENIDSDAYGLSNGLVKYEVTDNKDQTSYCFRVKSNFEGGKASVSEASNTALYYLPPELVTDSGFEANKFVAADEKGWNGSAGVFSFTDEEKASGNYSLKVDTVNNSANYTSLMQALSTEKGKIYQLTFKVKCESFTYDPQNDYNEPASFSFVNFDTGRTIVAGFLGATNNGDWTTRTVLCNVGDAENVGIKFMTGTSNAKYIMYLDDVSVKEVR